MNILAAMARKWLPISEEQELDAQSLVEYSLIILMVAVACVAVVMTMGTTVREVLWERTTQLPF